MYSCLTIRKKEKVGHMENYSALSLLIDNATFVANLVGLGLVCWVTHRLHHGDPGPVSTQPPDPPEAPWPWRGTCCGGISSEAFAAEVDVACQAIAARYAFSAREREILPYLLRGHKAISIAHALNMSESSVRTHVRRMHDKLNAAAAGHVGQTRP